jgi:hypothetical protein
LAVSKLFLLKLLKEAFRKDLSERGWPMARISPADLTKQSFFARNFVRFIYWMTRRRLGKVVMPIQVVSQHSKLLRSYVMMEQAQTSSHLVDASLKSLVQLRAASLVGCPF